MCTSLAQARPSAQFARRGIFPFRYRKKSERSLTITLRVAASTMGRGKSLSRITLESL